MTTVPALADDALASVPLTEHRVMDTEHPACEHTHSEVVALASQSSYTIWLIDPPDARNPAPCLHRLTVTVPVVDIVGEISAPATNEQSSNSPPSVAPVERMRISAFAARLTNAHRRNAHPLTAVADARRT
jgi:hypothetical protein